jgi:putative DNA primase/helicase
VKIQTSDGEEKRLFTRAKSNIGPDGGGYYYSIQQADLFDFQNIEASRIDWMEPVKGDARALLAEAEVSADHEEKGALSEVQEWLRELLIDEGSMEKREIMKLARENNFAARTVQRAREKLKLTHKMEGFGKLKKSIWSLPECENTICAKHENQNDSENVGTYDSTPENKGFKQGDLFIHANQPRARNLGTNGTNGEKTKDNHEVII